MKEHIIDYIEKEYVGDTINDYKMLEEIQKRGCSVEVKCLDRASSKIKVFKSNELTGEIVVVSEDTGTVIADIQKIKPSLADEYWSFPVYDGDSMRRFLLNMVDKQANPINIEASFEHDYIDFEIKDGKETKIEEINFAYDGETVDLYVAIKEHIVLINVNLNKKYSILGMFNKIDEEFDKGIRKELENKIDDFVKNELDLSKVYSFEYNAYYRNK